MGGEAAGHVLEQRTEPADVGVQDEAGGGHAVGPGVERGDLEPVDQKLARLERDVVNGSFSQR